MRLGSGVAAAVVQAGSYSPIKLLAWESAYAVGAALKSKKKKSYEKKKDENTSKI